MEVEDDLFFADLSKQLALLIMDDDEDPVVHCPSVSLQALSRVHHHHTSSTTAPSPFTYQQVYTRESKGTGVFIPRSSMPRRKNRQGKCNTSFSSKSSYRQTDGSRGGGVSNVTTTYSNEPSFKCYNSNYVAE
ncbi:hypothetical protein Scep_009360 [Stephania cephalantha]|uniref:Uncharacterized protein n=1 Tax=Stephania cephalantha TaxID=152367 RepID=A0AAP0JTM8_9MAGN